jgi:hypothetical protein
MVSNIQRHVNEIKKLNEYLFEHPSTQAPNKEGLAHPMAEAQRLPQARLVKLVGIAPSSIGRLNAWHVTAFTQGND